MNKRLPVNERKGLIRKAAMKIFLQKGFKETTMEDIIHESKMSKGGVYHHYKNKEDMLYDLMEDGMKYRLDLVEKYVKENEHLDKEALIMNMIMDKLFDYNEFKSLYVLFLIETKSNKKFQKLKRKMDTNMTKEFIEFCKKIGFEEYLSITNDAILFLMNSVFLGVDILSRNIVTDEVKEMFKIMFKAYMETNRKEEKNNE